MRKNKVQRAEVIGMFTEPVKKIEANHAVSLMDFSGKEKEAAGYVEI